VRDNALQGPIANICIRLAAMKTGDHVATRVSSTIGATTIPHAFSHCAKVRSSAMINRWISSLVFGIFPQHVRSLRRRSPDRHGRRVDYSIALVECLSAFFIMLIGFEGIRPRLAPGT
jgi:hypothetical protein